MLNVARKNQWGVLSERYAIPVMITLLQTKTPKMSDLTPAIGSYNTIENLIDDMEIEGLITQKQVTIPYKTTYISLTKVGWEVAKALHNAERIKKGEIDKFDESSINYETPSNERDQVNG